MISRLNLLVVFVVFCNFNYILSDISSSRSANPIFDLEDEAKGFYGTIGERNVLVDLKPHLQIKNIDAINGICSYHVFKPNTEEFPFTIDIKDKLTGEAVIELLKEFDSTNSTKSEEELRKSSPLDCNKRKEYHFLLQAYDCSDPAQVSAKVPVKIEVVDHDDYKQQFEMRQYFKKIIKSDEIIENFMTVKARDSDCTNNGYACSYEIVQDQLVPFKIDSTGSISTTAGLNKANTYTFKVKGFDCLNKDSYAEADVTIEVDEPCTPKFIDYQNEVLTSTSSIDNVFGLIKTVDCAEENTNQYCQIDSVNSKISLILDPSIQNTCETDACSDQNNIFESAISYTRDVLFSSESTEPKSSDNNADDDDSLEDSSSAEEDNNKVSPNKDALSKSSDFDQKKEPMNYRSFSKTAENAQKIGFDGNFGKEFTLSAWIRRPANADRLTKEQVFCGTDSNLMNRHHFGLYFYQGNVKFLMRHEPSTKMNDKKKDKKQDGIKDDEDFDTKSEFFPSLWEWSLNEALLKDAKWHFYEVKVNYPNASLYVDGVRFIENTTNSDIIDAYELNSVTGIGPITTFVGACYHARTQSLTDHFEGDVSSLVLTRKNSVQSQKVEQKQKSLIECSKNCRESIEVNLVGNENFINSIQNSNQNEINIQTSNLNDMEQLIRKVNYVNKQPAVQQSAPRSIKLQSKIHCINTGKTLDLNDIEVKLGLKAPKQEYNVQLDGDKTIDVDKDELKKGFEPFRHMSIEKLAINKVDSDASSNEGSAEDSDSKKQDDDKDADEIKLSMCQIKLIPERNLMAPFENNERVMFLQSLMDQFQFKFEETAEIVTISGVESAENYETFIRSLTYRIFNLKDTDDISLINRKEFDISCVRSEPNIETNTIRIYLNLKDKITKSLSVSGSISNKQAQKLVVNSENEQEILSKKNDDSNNKYSPMTIAFIVMFCCCLSFIVVFGAIKMYSSGFLSRRKKLVVNEENPQMEWDDSGLNITENPLDSLPKKCEYHDNPECRLDYEDEYSSSDSSDEGDLEERYDDEEEAYSSEEEPQVGKTKVERELEWDDSSLEIKARDQQLELEKQKNLHQQQMKNFI